MAAVRRTRRRTQLARRRRQTIRKRRMQFLRRRKQAMRRRRMQLARRRKQAMRRRRGHRRHQPKSRKGTAKRRTQGRKMRNQPKKAIKQTTKHTCDEFVSKVLRQLHRDKIPMSSKAKGKMISFIRRFYNNVADKAKSSKRVQLTHTIGTKDLQKALKRMMHNKQGMELVHTIQKASHRH